MLDENVKDKDDLVDEDVKVDIRGIEKVYDDNIMLMLMILLNYR